MSVLGRRARVRVKVCGLVCEEDAEAAIVAGADALGFNTWEGSRRYVDLRKAAGWVSALPPFVSRVVLCVNARVEWLEELAGFSFVDAVQFHGDETRELCWKYAERRRPFIRAIRLAKESDLEGLDQWSTRNVLVDAAVTGSFGGTGAFVDLDLAREAVERFPSLRVTVAGGLRPENVGEVVRALRPYAVDVASGVESSPGRKDPSKMRDFIQAVREASDGGLLED